MSAWLWRELQEVNQPTDPPIILGMMLAFIVVIAIRLSFEVWQYRRQSKRIVGLFDRMGANNPAGARRLDEVGLKLPSWHLGLRDYRGEALRVLIQDGSILRTPDGRFYLSPQAYRYYTRRDRPWP